MSFPPHDKLPSKTPSAEMNFTSRAAATLRQSASRQAPPIADPISGTNSTATEINYPVRHRSSADYWSTVLNHPQSAPGAPPALPQPGMASTGAPQFSTTASSTYVSQPFASGQEIAGMHRTASSGHGTTGTFGAAGSGSFHRASSPAPIFSTATSQMPLHWMTHPVYPHVVDVASQPFQRHPHAQTELSSNNKRAPNQQRHPHATVQHGQQHADDCVFTPHPPRPYPQPPAHSALHRSSGILGSSSVAYPLPSSRGGQRQGLEQNRPRARVSSEATSQQLEDGGGRSRGNGGGGGGGGGGSCDGTGDGGGSGGDYRSNTRTSEETGSAPPSAAGAGALAGPSTSRTVASGSILNPPKSFRCPVCSHQFERRGHLEEHMDSIHHNRQRFQCPVCSRRFGHRSSMRRHMTKLHEAP